ncbi:YhfC family intramembrane metalloprotease [Anaerosacchariphilus polymeriproducens]|uniref:DUF2324 domain-containing protein n=1 Tax=Anaerosacchariphilus polymeriproducens TaxID=1812858 RepID=A0A371AYD2_9FIRM|nr:YhfC family glutamic-type intramembrane protease [Anaerosacchariphilus polymeriproducens]RDU24605.1 DUF2324 domain-containing protein [Anaerosacchariphilus polymeriproducens]
MELGHVSAATMVAIVIVMIIAFALPIGLLIYGKVKLKGRISSFFIGCGVFFVMVLVLERILHSVVLGTLGFTITGNIWIYALYGGFAAAIFEETGRFIAMKFFLKKNLNFQNAFMYGAGHGGCEAIIIIGVSYFSNLITAIMVNNGSMNATLQLLNGDTQKQTYDSISALWTTPTYQFYLAGVERIFAIALQIAFSIIMYQAVKNGKKAYIAVAYLAHFIVDFVSVLVNNYAGVIVTEFIVAVMAALLLFIAYKISKKDSCIEKIHLS